MAHKCGDVLFTRKENPKDYFFVTVCDEDDFACCSCGYHMRKGELWVERSTSHGTVFHLDCVDSGVKRYTIPGTHWVPARAEFIEDSFGRMEVI